MNLLCVVGICAAQARKLPLGPRLESSLLSNQTKRKISSLQHSESQRVQGEGSAPLQHCEAIMQKLGSTKRSRQQCPSANDAKQR
jgi:hypothetical protein